MRTSLVTGFIIMCMGSGAIAQSTDLIGRQQNRTRNYYINSSVPTECHRPLYNAAMTWAASTANIKFVWAGYRDQFAWDIDPNTQINVSQPDNTLDTQSEIGFTDAYDVWGETHYRYPATGRYNAAANPKWTFTDGDHIISYDNQYRFHCGALPVPSGLRDMESHALHEFGHVWGLDHDSGDTTGVTVMYAPGRTGPSYTRTLNQRDNGRAIFIYGAKP